jgi:hypothetical protein
MMRLVRAAAVAMKRSGAVKLEAAGVMLADPGLGEAELLEILDQLEIALHAERRIFVSRVKGRQENAGPQVPGWVHKSPRRGDFSGLGLAARDHKGSARQYNTGETPQVPAATL